MKTPILGSSYVARSNSSSDNRMVNLFPERIDEGGKEASFLQLTPGSLFLSTVGIGPIRGLWQFGEFGYVASGTELYKITTNWNSVKLGNISGSGPVSMADNGTQLFVACNGPSYIYNSTTSAFAQITDVDFPGASTVTYIDGYFLFNQPGTQLAWVTNLLDGLSVEPLDFTSIEGSPDTLIAVKNDHMESWFFGKKSIQVYYDAALLDFPLAPIQGAFLEIGCVAPFSITKLDNSLFWLGGDDRGQGIIYRTNGYQGVRISTHAVEWQLQKYENLNEAIAYSYQQNGHSFYVLTVPGQSTTWVYDVSTDVWHERCSLVDGEFFRHRSNCQMNFGNKIIVGDYENGNLYSLDLNTYADNGNPLRWLRSWRAMMTGQTKFKRSTHHSLQIDFESGVGLESGQGSDPVVNLRWSDDGGYNWSNEHQRKIGKIGEKGRRVIWRRLGSTDKLRDRVYEVSGSDPVKTIINGAELMIGETNG